MHITTNQPEPRVLRSIGAPLTSICSQPRRPRLPRSITTHRHGRRMAHSPPAQACVFPSGRSKQTKLYHNVKKPRLVQAVYCLHCAIRRTCVAFTTALFPLSGRDGAFHPVYSKQAPCRGSLRACHVQAPVKTARGNVLMQSFRLSWDNLRRGSTSIHGEVCSVYGPPRPAPSSSRP